jgi:hypothetical protein
VTYLALGASLALTTFLAVAAALSLAVLVVWRMAERDPAAPGASSRAGGLFLLRTLPATSAFVWVAFVLLPAFHRYEPRESGEIVGPSLIVCSVLAAALITGALRRAAGDGRATRRLLRQWAPRARLVDLPGCRVRAYRLEIGRPVVTLVGLIRPRLFVSARVLDACSAEEVAAMVRHEIGHLAARDNLKRLVLRACPDPLSLTRLGRDIERRWDETAEEAADDYAARASAPAAVDLAGALLKVARMLPEPADSALASSVDGASILERRVRRLLFGHPSLGGPARWLLAARALAFVPLVAALAVLLDPRLLHGVHLAIEAVVEALP